MTESVKGIPTIFELESVKSPAKYIKSGFFAWTRHFSASIGKVRELVQEIKYAYESRRIKPAS